MKKINSLLRLSSILLLSFFFISSLNAQDKKQSRENKYEKEISALEKLDRVEKYDHNSILFVGSSSIRLWSTIKEDIAPYPGILRGFGGSKTPDVVYYLDKYVYPKYFRAVVFFIGNDITGSPDDLTPKETLHNFKEMSGLIRKEHKSEPIFIIEITPTSSRWKYWPQIQQTNALLKNFCKKRKNLYFIGTAQHFLNEKGEPRDELFRDDHLHLNREGYRIWGKLIKEELDKRLNVISS